MSIQQMLLGASGASGYLMDKSLRFRASASAYLNRTFATPTDGKKFTWSGWVKKADVRTGATGSSFALSIPYSTGAVGLVLSINGSNQLGYINWDGSTVYQYLYTNAEFRDPSAWYHIVFSFDSTQATAANRLLIYVNGVQQTITVSNAIGLNDTSLNNSGNRNICVGQGNSSKYFDGYLADVYFIDGQALTPSSFGETNALTGVWQPKAYTGTYGTNGFYLDFEDTSSVSALGNDKSGNGNNWTVNNISLTFGVTYDSMTDVPTLTSESAANYAVINPLGNNIGTTSTLSNGNLTATSGGNSWWNSSIAIPSTGKWYAEFNPASTSNDPWISVLASSSANAQYVSNGEIRVNGSTVTTVAGYTSSDTIGIAYDTAGTITFYKNNTSVYSGSLTYAAPMFFAGFVSTGNTINMNFGQRPFAYTPPTGFKALNTFNLPTATILKGNTVMDATTYTGNGGTLAVTNAAGFKPDLVWIKQRNVARDNQLQDSVRGVSLSLQSNTTSAESNYGLISSINSNGFTVFTNGTYLASNENGGSYVAWQWQAGQGTTSSNTNGTITSTVSVNATAGFSIVMYTGTGANATVGHGLGVAPKMIIVKRRDASEIWCVYTSTTGAGNYLALNSTIASTANTAVWNNTTPTSSVFSVAGSSATNNVGGTYVAYCFAEIEGFSKFGSYTGNSNADGPFIYLGFRPKLVIWKPTTFDGNWFMSDSSINPYNVGGAGLRPNASTAEAAIATNTNAVDYLSNGFKIRNNAASEGLNNSSGQTYIYAAFAENPFKNSLAR